MRLAVIAVTVALMDVYIAQPAVTDLAVILLATKNTPSR
jgi:hypothetical protein